MTRLSDAAVVAFYPGPAHNLDPAAAPQKIDRWNELDPALADYLAVRDAAQSTLKIDIQHTEKLTGGELQWPDERYRDLLLRAPRSIVGMRNCVGSADLGLDESLTSSLPPGRSSAGRDTLRGNAERCGR